MPVAKSMKVVNQSDKTKENKPIDKKFPFYSKILKKILYLFKTLLKLKQI